MNKKGGGSSMFLLLDEKEAQINADDNYDAKNQS